MTRPDDLSLSHPIHTAATPPTQPAMPPDKPPYVAAFCGKVAPHSLPSEHPHVCLAPRGHVADGLAHRCPLPCGHTWVGMSEEDAALLTALAGQLNELRLAGLAVRNVSVMPSDPLGYGFTEDKRRFRIEGDLVHAELEEPR